MGGKRVWGIETRAGYIGTWRHRIPALRSLAHLSAFVTGAFGPGATHQLPTSCSTGNLVSGSRNRDVDALCLGSADC